MYKENLCLINKVLNTFTENTFTFIRSKPSVESWNNPMESLVELLTR